MAAAVDRAVGARAPMAWRMAPVGAVLAAWRSAPRSGSRRSAGYAALGVTLAASVALAAGAAGRRSLDVVPAAKHAFPDWLRGPLAHLGLGLDTYDAAAVLCLLFVSYVVVVACATAPPARVVVAAIVVLHVVFLLAPPMFSADVFSYIDYARLGLLHGLDPYTHGAAAAPADPVTPFVRWHDVSSPYGPVFTMSGYALAHLSVATTLWVYKAIAAIAGLGCVALVWRIAARTGTDPRAAAVFVALNPLFLVYAVGGAHNDTLLELLVLGAIAAHVGSRERIAGAQIAIAALVKISAGLVLVFLVAGSARRGRVVAGAATAAAAVAIAALVVLSGDPFGFVGELLFEQRLVAHYSVPNELALLLGGGGLTQTLQTTCLAAFCATLAWQLWRVHRGADWIECAGWAMLAGLLASAWLLPWYAVWLLPLAAVAPSRALRASTLAFSAYLVATHVLMMRL